ncbi:RNA-directed DNA polymerase, eukaryota, reverse transcriptase zinc-binding domain protein [Tanacetum coccineum]
MPFNRTTAPKANFTNLKVNTVGDKTVSDVGGKKETAIKASADRISKWHPNKDMKCTLCNEEMDSHDHLFFKCIYTEKVWNEAKIKCQVKEKRNEWKCILEELIKMPNKRNIWIVIKKITFAACIYLIWQERNSRIFQGVHKDWKEVWGNIEGNVKMK